MVKTDYSRDYYADLGLSSDADLNEIKKQFRKLGRSKHALARTGDPARPSDFLANLAPDQPSNTTPTATPAVRPRRTQSSKPSRLRTRSSPAPSPRQSTTPTEPVPAASQVPREFEEIHGRMSARTSLRPRGAASPPTHRTEPAPPLLDTPSSPTPHHRHPQDRRTRTMHSRELMRSSRCGPTRGDPLPQPHSPVHLIHRAPRLAPGPRLNRGKLPTLLLSRRRPKPRSGQGLPGRRDPALCPNLRWAMRGL